MAPLSLYIAFLAVFPPVFGVVPRRSELSTYLALGERLCATLFETRSLERESWLDPTVPDRIQQSGATRAAAYVRATQDQLHADLSGLHRDYQNLRATLDDVRTVFEQELNDLTNDTFYGASMGMPILPPRDPVLSRRSWGALKRHDLVDSSDRLRTFGDLHRAVHNLNSETLHLRSLITELLQWSHAGYRRSALPAIHPLGRYLRLDEPPTLGTWVAWWPRPAQNLHSLRVVLEVDFLENLLTATITPIGLHANAPVVTHAGSLSLLWGQLIEAHYPALHEFVGFRPDVFFESDRRSAFQSRLQLYFKDPSRTVEEVLEHLASQSRENPLIF